MKVIFFLLTIFSSTCFATSLTLGLSENLISNSPAVKKLREMRTLFEKDKFDTCLSTAPKALQMAKSLEPWILSLELECAGKLPLARTTAETLQNLLSRADSKAQLMLVGPWVDTLKANWAKARLRAIEVDTKFNRPRAWVHFEKLARAVSTSTSTSTSSTSSSRILNEADRAKLWRMAGELMFLQQKNEGAIEFFRRSLAEQDQSDLRDRVRALVSNLPSSAAEASGAPSLPPTIKQPEGSQKEIELYNLIAESLRTGDLVASSSDAVKLINNFPGSPRAKWAADRTLESLISVAEKNNEKFLPVRDSLLKNMDSAETDRVAEWSRVLFNRGLWQEATRLGKVAAAKQSDSRATRTLEITMDSAYAIDDFKTVRSMAEQLIEKHAGTAAARTAALRMGLLSYRSQDYSQAVAYFEKLVATPSSETLELQARYWLWRSLEKLKNDRAKIEAEELSRRFPFSYYGLRARLELSGGTIDWSKENPKVESKANRIESKIWLTSEEKLAFDRALVLVSAGWFEEAQEELRTLPAPNTPDAKAVRARVWAAAKNFLLASKLANEAWDAKFELRRPELMSVVWPAEHREFFESASRAKSVDSLLVRSLTKQESGFNPTAVSSSGALGLMQMIPPTAREIADDLKQGRLNLPDDMFQPERNITMGTHYIAKLLTQFKGHVPLALAAYNNGPTRVDRWIKGRPSLAGLEQSRSSSPDSELWIDEFPFNETSFYVKAILRNQMLYQIVESGRLIAQEPLWKSSSAVAGR